MTRGETDQLAALAEAVLATGYLFVTPTPATHARVTARPGRAIATSLRDVFGWSLPFPETLLPPQILQAMHAADVLAPVDAPGVAPVDAPGVAPVNAPGDAPAPANLHRSRVRISTLEGLGFLHSAYPTTQPDSVFFGPDTYRFAAAIAAELARRTTPIHRAVDIGCGAGPGAILLARANPAAQVHAVDINPAALRLARANALAARTRVDARESDLLSALPGEFDLVVANPPYMADPARRAYRDGGGPLGADLSLRILQTATDRLAPGGTLLLYTGAAIVDGHDPFHHAASALLAATPLDWTYREIDPDVFGEELDHGPYATAERIAAVVLTATRKE